MTVNPKKHKNQNLPLKVDLYLSLSFLFVKIWLIPDLTILHYWENGFFHYAVLPHQPRYIKKRKQKELNSNNPEPHHAGVPPFFVYFFTNIRSIP